MLELFSYKYDTSVFPTTYWLVALSLCLHYAVVVLLFKLISFTTLISGDFHRLVYLVTSRKSIFKYLGVS